MEFTTHIGKNVLAELKQQAVRETADISNSIGDLFILKGAPIAGIRLRIPLADYLGKVTHRAELIPTDDEIFTIVINAEVTVHSGKTFIDGKEAVLLPEM